MSAIAHPPPALDPHKSKRLQLLIRFGYDGARFHGLQPQTPGVATAGGALIDRLTRAAGTPPRGMNFAARTDAGVHAINNAATCFFRTDLKDDEAIALPPTDEILARVCDNIDDGLKNVRAEIVPYTVHARGSSEGKRYRYRIVPDAAVPTRKEQSHPDAWHIAPALSLERMQAGARLLVGTNDFASLKSPRCTMPNTHKTLARVEVTRDGPAIVIELCGDAFLRQMVRNIAGLLVEVGSGLRSPQDVTTILSLRDRQAAGLCAPPEGLTLVDVGFLWPPDGSARLPELSSAL